MAVIEIASFDGDTIVLHFGGEPGFVNAETFARSLLGFVQTANAVNASINPGQAIEVTLEAFGEGSFRALLRRVQKDY